MATPLAPVRDVYTVSRLNREARGILERGFATIWLEGELSNLARPASGHWYFSLKDANAQIRAAMFRQRNMNAGFVPKDGLHVLVRARVSLYEPRGDYQLIVEHMEEAGEGALRRQFEELKNRLLRAGLFAEEHKRKLPALPRRIGVVTSPTGAAIRDVLHILKRRFPAIPVLIFPVPVQGAAAAPAIAEALREAGERGDCDVLILARGGGSLEDLWAFNDERVARAIYDCPIPVVCGIGHEIDFTIADFVADVRAPTPSGAAELVAPDQRVWRRAFADLLARLDHFARTLLARRSELLEWLGKRLAQAHPGARLAQQAQRLDDFGERLRLATVHRLEVKRGRLNTAVRALHAVSPLATLERGYAVVTREPGGALLRSALAVRPDERLRIRVADGSVCAVVERQPEEK
jgi:exodeoxyribonuclease VII large subunit